LDDPFSAAVGAHKAGD